MIVHVSLGFILALGISCYVLGGGNGWLVAKLGYFERLKNRFDQKQEEFAASARGYVVGAFNKLEKKVDGFQSDMNEKMDAFGAEIGELKKKVK